MNQFLRIIVAVFGLLASTNAFTTPVAPMRTAPKTTALNLVDPAITAMVDKSDPAFTVLLFVF